MAQRRDRRQGSLLDNLPAELRSDASPEFCCCRSCQPSMTEGERAQHEAAAKIWNAARRTWCVVNGYSLLELLRAEHRRPRGTINQAKEEKE